MQPTFTRSLQMSDTPLCVDLPGHTESWKLALLFPHWTVYDEKFCEDLPPFSQATSIPGDVGEGGIIPL